MIKTVPYKALGGHALLITSELTIISLAVLISITTVVATTDAGTFVYVTNSADNTVSIIDTANNNVEVTVKVGKLPFGLATSPDGRMIYVVNYFSNNVSVIDTATNTVIASVNVGSLPFVTAVSPEGNKLYVANFASNNISIINTTTNVVTAEISGVSCPWGIAVNPDGTKIYSVSLNSNITSVIDTSTNTVVARVNVGNNPWEVVVSPDGKKVFVTNSNSNTVSIIDAAKNTVVAVVKVGDGPWGLAVSPDGAKAYVANSNSNNVSVIDTATNTVTATVKVGSLPCGVTVNPDGTKAYVVNSDSNNVSVINTATNTVTASVNVGNLPVAIGKIVVPLSTFVPVANFSSNVSSGYAPLFVQFTDLSKNATGLKWNFGDGSNSTQKNVTYIYFIAGTYTVKLTVSNANGIDSKTSNISVIKKEEISTLLSKNDNRLREASPVGVFSNSLFLDVGGVRGVGRYRDVLSFDTNALTSATKIKSVTLSLFWYYPNSSRLKDTIVEIYRPASAWNTSYVSWNKKNKGIAWSKPGGDWYDKNGVLQGSTPYATLTLKASSLASNSYCEFDVTDLVKEYVGGKYSNTGFLIKARNESDNYIAFYSTDVVNKSQVPKLKLVYS